MLTLLLCVDQVDKEAVMSESLCCGENLYGTTKVKWIAKDVSQACSWMHGSMDLCTTAKWKG